MLKKDILFNVHARTSNPLSPTVVRSRSSSLKSTTPNGDTNVHSRPACKLAIYHVDDRQMGDFILYVVWIWIVFVLLHDFVLSRAKMT